VTEKLVDLQKNIFAFYLDSTPGDEKSAIIFGVNDDTYYSGSINYVPVVNEMYWMISLDDVVIGNNHPGECNGWFVLLSYRRLIWAGLCIARPLLILGHL
jgi:hypothetical protein